VAELMGGIKLSGFIAWLMWRNIYLSKLPGWDRKVRVALDWTLDLILPRELSYINLARTQMVNQVHYEPGDFIFHQGDVGDEFYVIVSGQVEVLKELPSGQTVQLAQLGKGEYFGETALLTGRRRNASARANGPVDLLCLGRDEFTSLAGTWLKFSESVQALSEVRAKAQVGRDELNDDSGTAIATSVYVPQLAAQAASGGNASKSQELAPTPATPPSPPLPPFLVRSDGAELRLDSEELHLGRAPTNHVVVNDGRVSRRHALLKREGKHYVLEDVGTANGTYVNNQRIQRHILAEGDVIRLGQTVFTYREPAF
jgi:hypothetical protein